MKQPKYFLSNENFYFIYVSNPKLAINKEINYFLHKRNEDEFKHTNSSIQASKCMDYIDALELYTNGFKEFNNTNTQFRKIKYKSMGKFKDKIKYTKKKIEVTYK